MSETVPLANKKPRADWWTWRCNAWMRLRWGSRTFIPGELACLKGLVLASTGGLTDPGKTETETGREAAFENQKSTRGMQGLLRLSWRESQRRGLAKTMARQRRQTWERTRGVHAEEVSMA